MKKIIYAVLAFSPVLAFAQNGSLSNLRSLIDGLKGILGVLIPMAFGLAILFFFYGIALYVLAAGDAAKAKEGKSIMIYGVIAIAVMASVYGLVLFLQNAFGVSTTATITVPTVPGISQ